MKKFEEEFDKNVNTFGVVGQGECCQVHRAKNLGHGWVSPQDHLKVVEDLTNARSSITNLMAQLDYYKKDKRFEAMAEEILSLKSQLEKQQPEIPEVPYLVADWYEENKGSLDYMIFETCRDLTDESTDEFENWFGYDENKAITTLVHMKNGYTVKEKRFYLKHKSVLIFDPDSDDSDVEELYLGAGGNFVPYKHLAKIFTQQEIDSMETASYEQIEVEE